MTKRIRLALLGLGGLLLLLAAERFARPELIGPGLLLFAAGTFAAGADAIIRRYSVERNRETVARATFQGTAAVLIGVALVILSCAFAAAGASFLLGMEDGVYALLKQRPGGALLVLGTISGAGGGARVLGAREWGGSAGRILGGLAAKRGLNSTEA